MMSGLPTPTHLPCRRNPGIEVGGQSHTEGHAQAGEGAKPENLKVHWRRQSSVDGVADSPGQGPAKAVKQTATALGFKWECHVFEP